MPRCAMRFLAAIRHRGNLSALTGCGPVSRAFTARAGKKIPVDRSIYGDFVCCGGGRGIRTHEGRKALPVFKTGAFNRSASPPRAAIVTQVTQTARRPSPTRRLFALVLQEEFLQVVEK